MRTTSLSLDPLRHHLSRRKGFWTTTGPLIGMAKTHLQHVLTATAINFTRISNWLWDFPREKTRTSAFEKLMRPVPAVAVL
jgi:hypothetical protein